MTGAVLRTTLAAAGVVVGLVVAIEAGLPPGPTVEVAVLACAAAVGLRAAGRLPGDDHRPPPAPATPRGRDPVGAARDRIAAGLASAGGRHFLLAPRLRDLAAHRCERHGVDLDDPAAAEALLGRALHELVRPDRGRPRDRDAAGVDLDAVVAAVDRLERL